MLIKKKGIDRGLADIGVDRDHNNDHFTIRQILIDLMKDTIQNKDAMLM